MKFRMIAAIILSAGICINAAARGKCVVIPVDFPDLEMSYSQEELESLVDSCSSFLEKQLGKDFAADFVMTPKVRLTKSYAYYGANSPDRKDALAPEAVFEACVFLDPQFDFMGTKDVILITAGMNESYGAGDDYFWPSQSRLSDFNITLVLDSQLIDSYGITTEKGPDGKMSGPGDICHEYGHFIGMKDLYDTDGYGSGGLCEGLDTLSIMASGNRRGNGHRPSPFCCIDFDHVGVFKGSIPTRGTNRLNSLYDSKEYFRIPYSVSGRYSLLENRNGELLAFEVDKSDTFAGISDSRKKNLSAAERWNINEVNCNPEHQCAKLLWAGSKGWFQADTMAVTGIVSQNGQISFSLLTPIISILNDAYQDGIRLVWATDFLPEEVESSGITWWTEEGGITDVSVTCQPDGRYCHIIENLKPSTTYQISTRVSTREGQSFSRNMTVRTQDRAEGSSPFIMLDSKGRNADGSFISGSSIMLRLRNKPAGAVSVEWEFDGRQIHAGADGCWTIPGSGFLKAKIIMEDGSEEIILKKINVR